ncbi:hypothetical protein B0T21DRAFT_354682 [Apiosordaria backusii]|uniref:Uncharacterized protein n=1 Tax=Apiosordaria backusii TaxID=314023 RepID=A0AA40EXZ0_9PEZI|nr:hypothetical protein B0T21DRAFT_354682 [Apiosordaria backusii]
MLQLHWKERVDTLNSEKDIHRFTHKNFLHLEDLSENPSSKLLCQKDEARVPRLSAYTRFYRYYESFHQIPRSITRDLKTSSRHLVGCRFDISDSTRCGSSFPGYFWPCLGQWKTICPRRLSLAFSIPISIKAPMCLSVTSWWLLTQYEKMTKRAGQNREFVPRCIIWWCMRLEVLAAATITCVGVRLN